MRFASAGSYITAGRNAASSGLEAVIAARKNSPDYASIAEQAQAEEVKNFVSDVDRRSDTAVAKMKAEQYVEEERLAESMRQAKRDNNSTVRKAGIIAAAGGYAAKALKKKKEDKLNQEAYADYEKLIEESQTKADNLRNTPGEDETSTYEESDHVTKLREKLEALKSGSSGASGATNSGNVLTGDWKTTADLVGKYESKGSGDYNAYNLGGKDGGHTAIGSGDSTSSQSPFGGPLTTLTIGQVRQLGDQGKIHATGRYQFTHNSGSFGEAVQFAGLKDTDKFNAENQDKMFKAFATKYGPSRWVGLGKATPEEMQVIRTTMGF